MPIYEYQCQQCKERHEIIQRFSDAPVEHCPACGGDMKKLISSPAIQFKGSGFYKTDYPSASSKSGASTSSQSSDSKSDSKSESKAETASETRAETKTESKPEAKSESKAGE